VATLQVAHLVLNGGRPEIPAPTELPGPDRPSPEQLRGYIQLVRCVRRVCAPRVQEEGRAESQRGKKCWLGPLTRLPARAASALPCRECWAQNPYDRPAFRDIVPRLRALAGPGPGASSRSLAQSGSSARRGSAAATVGSPQLPRSS
jgi:hypothetical protein